MKHIITARDEKTGEIRQFLFTEDLKKEGLLVTEKENNNKCPMGQHCYQKGTGHTCKQCCFTGCNGGDYPISKDFSDGMVEGYNQAKKELRERLEKVWEHPLIDWVK